MFKLLSSIIVGFFAFSLPALAHEGHDHSHWSSSFVHLVSILAVVALVLAIAHSIKKVRKAKKQEKETL